MANPHSDTYGINQSRRSISKRQRARIFVVVAPSLFAALSFYLLKNNASLENTEGVFADDNGSVKQVENYIRQNILSHPDSFIPIHWSKLQKTNVFGSISYKVAVIYKARNNKNEEYMDSKIFELDERGMVLFVMDSGPMNNK
jgi:hypothetical protein